MMTQQGAATADPARTARPARTTHPRLRDLGSRAVVLLAAHAIDAQRISLGLVFLGFGVLKFFPGVSPAAGLAAHTVETLTFGAVSGQAAVLTTACIETFVGLTLLTGVLLRAGLAVLAVTLLAIMSPLVLFPGELFPGGRPTLTAQYVVKDIVLVTAAAVVAAKALGARFDVPDDAA